MLELFNARFNISNNIFPDFLSLKCFYKSNWIELSRKLLNECSFEYEFPINVVYFLFKYINNFLQNHMRNFHMQINMFFI